MTFRLTESMILLLLVAPLNARADQTVKMEGGRTITAQMPALALLSAPRRTAFEQEFTKKFKVETKSIEGHERDEPVLPLPLRGPVGTCDGDEIYVLSDAEIKVKTQDGRIEQDVLSEGSAGMPLLIYSSKPGSMKFNKMFEESVQSFYGKLASDGDNKSCPEFVGRFHGSHYGRVGYLTGNSIIHYETKLKRWAD